jgi:hypothetical protein
MAIHAEGQEMVKTAMIRDKNIVFCARALRKSSIQAVCIMVERKDAHPGGKASFVLFWFLSPVQGRGHQLAAAS